MLVSGDEQGTWICSTGRTDACLIASVHALGRVAVAAKKKEISAEEMVQKLAAALCVLIKKCEEAEA